MITTSRTARVSSLFCLLQRQLSNISRQVQRALLIAGKSRRRSRQIRRKGSHCWFRPMHAVTIDPQGNVTKQGRKRHEKNTTIIAECWIHQIVTIVEIIPQGMCPLSNAGNKLALTFRIAKHCSKATRVHVFRQNQEILGVELKAFGILTYYLIDAVEELNENGRDLSFVATVATRCVAFASSLSMGTSRMKRMPKAHEILFHQYRKALACPIVWIKKQLGKNSNLAGTIPTVTAMQQDGQSMDVNPICRFP